MFVTKLVQLYEDLVYCAIQTQTHVNTGNSALWPSWMQQNDDGKSHSNRIKAKFCSCERTRAVIQVGW